MSEKTEPDFFSTLVNAGIAHYQREGILKALDFVAGLSGEEVKDLTQGMTPEQTARVFRVWQATKATPAKPGGLPHD